MDEERLAEGYKEREERSKKLSEQASGASAEATDLLGEAPEIDDPLTMNEIEELQKKILNELYDKAEPPADFDKIRNNADKQPDNWYHHHYLPSNKQEEIFDKHTEDAPLTNSQRTALAFTCITGLGPTSNKELAEEKTGRELE